MRKVDWIEMEQAYITGGDDVTYAALALAHGLSFSAVSKRGRKGCWAEARAEYRRLCVKNAVDDAAKQQAARFARAIALGDRLIERIEKALAQIEIHVERGVVRERTVKYENPALPHKVTGEIVKETPVMIESKGPVDRSGLRQIAAALRDVQAVVQPEQQQTPESGNITVTLSGEADAYSV